MRLYSKALVTAIFAAATSTAAFAADTVANERVGGDPATQDNVNGSADTSTNSVAKEVANERVGTGMTYADLETTINTYGTTGFDASILDSTEGGELDVMVVPTSEIDGMNAENEARLAQIVADQQEHIDMVRGELANRGEIQAALQNAGYDANDVIAVRTGVDGRVTLVVM